MAEAAVRSKVARAEATTAAWCEPGAPVGIEGVRKAVTAGHTRPHGGWPHCRLQQQPAPPPSVAALRPTALRPHYARPPSVRREVVLEHFGRVLVVEAEHAVLVLLDRALGRRELAAHQLEQRRLAAAVGADEGDARVAVDANVEVLVEVILRLARVGEAHLVKGQDRRREARALGEGESERALAQLGALDGVALHLLEHLLFRLGA
eukprot:3047049-Prymnesium_polylepis.1